MPLCRTLAVAVAGFSVLAITVSACASTPDRDTVDDQVAACLEDAGQDSSLVNLDKRRLDDAAFNSAFEDCAAALSIKVLPPGEETRQADQVVRTSSRASEMPDGTSQNPHAASTASSTTTATTGTFPTAGFRSSRWIASFASKRSRHPDHRTSILSMTTTTTITTTPMKPVSSHDTSERRTHGYGRIQVYVVSTGTETGNSPPPGSSRRCPARSCVPRSGR